MDYAKKNPGKLNYGSTVPLFTMLADWIQKRAGITLNEIRYKTTPQANQDALGGQLQLYVTAYGPMEPNVRAGKLRVLAITAGRRDPATPDIPAVAETVPGFEMAPWWGMFAPAGTPREVVAKLNAESVRILALPDIKAHYAGLGMAAISNSPEQFHAYVQEEIARWAKVVKATGARAD